MSKITKLCLNLSTLCLESSDSFFRTRFSNSDYICRFRPGTVTSRQCGRANENSRKLLSSRTPLSLDAFSQRNPANIRTGACTLYFQVIITCNILVPSKLKNAEHLTVRLRLQWNRAIGLQSVVLCTRTISAFWTVADVYSADNVSRIMNLKAINRYI